MSTAIYQDLPLVRDIQEMLNAVRCKYHGSWEHLSVDGKYGPRSRNAVKQFKISVGFIPANDDLTSSFIDRLREEYAREPKLSSCTDDIDPYYDTGKLEDRYPILKIVDLLSDLITHMSDFVNSESEYIKQTGRPKPKIIERLSLHVSRFDKRFAQMQASIEAAEKSQSAIDTQNTIIKQNEDLARRASKGDFNARSQNTIDTLHARTAQNEIAKAQMNRKIQQKNLYQARESSRSIMNKILNDLKKYDLVGKIDRKVQEFLPKGGQYGTGKVRIQVKAGGFLFTLISLKDLIYDLFTYENSDAWRAKTTAHLYDFIDGMIIGLVSVFLAEILLIAGAAAIGTAGAGAIIITILAVIIATVIGLFFEKHNISLSQMIVDYCAAIVPAF